MSLHDICDHPAAAADRGDGAQVVADSGCGLTTGRAGVARALRAAGALAYLVFLLLLVPVSQASPRPLGLVVALLLAGALGLGLQVAAHLMRRDA